MHLKSNNTLSRVLASSVALLLMTTSLHAIPRDPCDEPPPPVCCEDPLPGPFAFSYPFDMDLNCPRDFYFYVDGLAMQAKEDGLEFALRNSNSVGTAGASSITDGKFEGFAGNDHDADWQPGMRLGFGLYLDHDAWNLDFDWTWLNITNLEQADATTGGGQIIPQWLLGIGDPANLCGPHSSGKWNASYNTFDITLGKPYYVSRYFIANPFFGIRGSSIDQKIGADYGGNIAGGAATRTVFNAKNDFYGAGARAGIKTDWILGRGWSLFGNVAASMQWGKFKIDQNLTLPGSGQDGYALRYNFYQNVPNIEMQLGIGWGYYFNKKRNHVALRAAYEFHEWFDQLNLRKFFSGSTGLPNATAVVTNAYANDTVSRGNLTLNGVSLRLQFDM